MGPCSSLEFYSSPAHRSTCKRASPPACFAPSAKTIHFWAQVPSVAHWSRLFLSAIDGTCHPQESLARAWLSSCTVRAKVHLSGCPSGALQNNAFALAWSCPPSGAIRALPTSGPHGSNTCLVLTQIQPWDYIKGFPYAHDVAPSVFLFLPQWIRFIRHAVFCASRGTVLN